MDANEKLSRGMHQISDYIEAVLKMTVGERVAFSIVVSTSTQVETENGPAVVLQFTSNVDQEQAREMFAAGAEHYKPNGPIHESGAKTS